jgi:2-dehydropantoate 2-reductase
VRIAVLGAGAVGAYYGSRFAEGGADVSLIARGRHLEALRSDGLTVVEPERRTTHRLLATDDPADLGPVDLVLFCVKSYDTDTAARQLSPLLGPDTAVLSLQNGIDNEDRIAAAAGPDHVIGGAAYILGSVRGPGVVEAAGPRRIVIGELRPGPPSDRILAIAGVGEQAGLRVDAVDDVRVAKWEKYTLLVAFSAMTATVRLPLGPIRDSPAAATMLRAIMSEVWSVGRAIGVPLADDLVDVQMDLLLSQADGATTSLYHDLVTGHRMELEALQGAALRHGREAGVPTPSIEAAYAILEPWAMRNEQPADDRRPIPA